jgi:predicted TIM-barrel fold metal-dependent hydrolase
VPYAEGQVAFAYNRWFSERVASAEPRIAFAPLLPMRTPAVCEQIVQEMSGRPGVVAFSVSSLRYDRVYDNEYARLYAMLAERELPLIFRASPSWEWSDRWSRTMNRFLTIDALTTPYSNAVHLANWIVSGMPERFPALTTVWLRSGLASILFLAQRLDSLFPKRTSEAPALRCRPSEYLREMYFGSQPLEREHPAALELAFDLIDAENQLIYASAFPDWNFDPPSTVLNLPFLSDNGRRNILGLTARKLFSL